MGTLLTILAILFLALFIIIPLVEKYAPQDSGRGVGSLARWILPLVALLLVLQLVQHYFF